MTLAEQLKRYTPRQIRTAGKRIARRRVHNGPVPGFDHVKAALRCRDDWTHREIAEELGTKRGTVSVALSKLVPELVRELES